MQVREFYRGSAARASLLYFILNDLNKINPMYQFSLKAFSVVFDVAIKVAKHCLSSAFVNPHFSSQRAAKDKDVAKRVQNLTDSITFMVFQYTARGLFECDKLIFTAQMTFQILLTNNEINPAELDFLLRL